MVFTSGGIYLTAIIMLDILSGLQSSFASTGLAHCNAGFRVEDETFAMSRRSAWSREACLVACKSNADCSTVSFVNKICTLYPSRPGSYVTVQEVNAQHCSFDPIPQPTHAQFVSSTSASATGPTTTEIPVTISTTAETTDTTLQNIETTTWLPEETATTTVSISTSETANSAITPTETNSAITETSPSATETTQFTVETETTGATTSIPGKTPMSSYYFIQTMNMTWDNAEIKCGTQWNGTYTIAWANTQERQDAIVKRLYGQNKAYCFWIGLIKKPGSSQWSWNEMLTMGENDFNMFYDPAWLTQVFDSTVNACVSPFYNHTWIISASNEFYEFQRYYPVCQAVDQNYTSTGVNFSY